MPAAADKADRKCAYNKAYRAANIDAARAREVSYKLLNPNYRKEISERYKAKKDMKLSEFKSTTRICPVCFKLLELINTRDIARKKYCSISCKNSASAANRKFKPPVKECLVCGEHFKVKCATHKYCSSKCSATHMVTRSYKSLNGNPRRYIMHLICKPGRKHLAIESMLELLEKQNGLCAITGLEMSFTKRRDGIKVHTNLSIDQIEAGKGYSIDNIQFVCAVINVMKTTLSVQDFRRWCTKVVEGGK